jgi:hypothetical protein
MTTTTKLQNALLRKNGEFIVKDQIIFQYPKAVTAQQVKAQVDYLLDKRALKASVEVKQLDKNKHIFLISGPGLHNWNGENVSHGFVKPRPLPPPPPPIYPVSVTKNTLFIQQKGLINQIVFRTDSFKVK